MGNSLVCHMTDYMHASWRLRVQSLQPDKTLYIGPFRISFLSHLRISEKLTMVRSHLCTGGAQCSSASAVAAARIMWPLPARTALSMHAQVPLGMRYNYLNYRDKQNNAGTLALGDLRMRKPEGGGPAVVTEVTTLRTALRAMPEYWGTYMFVEFLNRYERIFTVKGRSPAQCVVDAAFCLTFGGRWRQTMTSDVAKAGQVSDIFPLWRCSHPAQYHTAPHRTVGSTAQRRHSMHTHVQVSRWPRRGCAIPPQ